MSLPSIDRPSLKKLKRLQDLREMRLLDVQKQLHPLRARLHDANQHLFSAQQKRLDLIRQQDELLQRVGGAAQCTPNFFILARARSLAITEQTSQAQQEESKCQEHVQQSQAALDDHLKRIMKERHRIDSLAKRMSAEHVKHLVQDEANQLDQDEPKSKQKAFA